MLELRKLNGKRRVARLSVRASSASICTAVVLPLVEASPGCWRTDCSVAPPVLVPLLSLGRRMVAAAADGGGSCLREAAPAEIAGGPALCAMDLTSELFAAAEMKVVKKGLLAMKVAELKEELEARRESVSGNKAWLRRRLHAAILCKQLRRERRARVQREWGGRERVRDVFGAEDSDARSDSDS